MTVAHFEQWGNVMVLAWFDAKEAKAFGEGLANFYLDRSKVDSRGKRIKLAERKQRELLDKLTGKVVIFRRVCKLNVYKKAQFANVFKWRLLDAGVEPAYVDELTRWVMHHL
jgi:hypothetical protein